MEASFWPGHSNARQLLLLQLTTDQVRDATGMSRNTTRSLTWSIPSIKITRNVTISRRHSHVSGGCSSASPFASRGPLAVVYKIHKYYSVCIRDQKEAFSVRPRFPDHFQYLVLDVEDNEEQNVIRLFPEYVPYNYSSGLKVEPVSRRADQFIQQALTQGGKVLVHCNGAPILSRTCARPSS